MYELQIPAQSWSDSSSYFSISSKQESTEAHLSVTLPATPDEAPPPTAVFSPRRRRETKQHQK